MKLIRTCTTRGLLLVSGLLATGIAAAILFAPDAFYAGTGIDLGSNTSLANEIKAPMGMLLVAGLFMLVGVFRTSFVVPSLAAGTFIYLSFGLSRLLSMAIDGVPDSAMISAAMIELVIGTLCLAELLPARRAVAA